MHIYHQGWGYSENNLRVFWYNDAKGINTALPRLSPKKIHDLDCFGNLKKSQKMTINFFEGLLKNTF
jgi:hypothetical protein